MWSSLFTATNSLAVAGWVLLAAFPRKPLTHSLILYLGVALLCLTYLVCFAMVRGGFVDPGLPAGSAAVEPNFTSIAGVRAFFQSDAGVVIGWTHYLAFDLFTGMWIARDADAKGFSRLVQLPFLFFTFLLGPIGLLGWLVVRERAARRLGRG
jgi:predicted small integral membrane protein